MRSPRALCAAGLLAATLVLAPAVGASAAAPVHADAAKHYTLTVTGNGTSASVFYIAMNTKSTKSPTFGQVAAAHLPWKKRISGKSDLVEVVATQKGGTHIGCSIKNAHGTVLTRSVAYGAHGIVSCIVSSADLLGKSGSLTSPYSVTR